MKSRTAVLMTAALLVGIWYLLLGRPTRPVPELVDVQDFGPSTGSDPVTGITEQEAIDRVRQLVDPAVEWEDVVARKMTVEAFSKMVESGPGLGAPEMGRPVWVVAFTTTNDLTTTSMRPWPFAGGPEVAYPGPTPTPAGPTPTAITLANEEGITTGYYVLFADGGELYAQGILSPQNPTWSDIEKLEALPTATAGSVVPPTATPD